MKKQNQKLLENRSGNLSHRRISLGIPVLKKWEDKDGYKSLPEPREKDPNLNHKVKSLSKLNMTSNNFIYESI